VSGRREAFNWWANLCFEIKRGLPAFSAVALLVGGSILVDARRVAWLKSEGRPTVATISALYVLPSKWQPGWVTVEARSANGLIGRVRLPRDRLTGCERRDLTAATQVGDRLRLEPWPCTGRFPLAVEAR
jgi:hypothetical protein